MLDVRTLTTACIAVLWLSTTQALASPSFNCRDAATYVELAICDSRELSRLDRILAREFRAAMNRLGRRDRAFLANEQARWIGERDSCESYGCVEDAYRTRIADLRLVGF